MNIVSHKIINNQNSNYSALTQISLTESLISKINRRNFNVLNEIIKVFDEIKYLEKNNYINCLFDLNSENINNVNYFNETKNIKNKFEIFKILAIQIINIIKEILTYKERNKNILNLERNPSTVLENDLNKITNKILSFFFEINPECFYFDDLILFFYKIFINFDILLRYIIMSDPNVIRQIIEISFNKDLNIKYNTKLIMIKLLCQIIEDIKEDDFEYFSKSIQYLEKGNLIIKNPLNYLIEKLLKELKDKNNNLKSIIYKYYINLLLICLNKANNFKKSKDDNIVIITIDNKILLNKLLFEGDCSFLSENKFIIKTNKSNTFENIALFNSDKNKSIKKGKIICFLEKNLTLTIT